MSDIASSPVRRYGSGFVLPGSEQVGVKIDKSHIISAFNTFCKV